MGISDKVNEVLDIVDQWTPSAKGLVRFAVGLIEEIQRRTKDEVIIEEILPAKIQELRELVESTPDVPTEPDADLKE